MGKVPPWPFCLQARTVASQYARHSAHLGRKRPWQHLPGCGAINLAGVASAPFSAEKGETVNRGTGFFTFRSDHWSFHYSNNAEPQAADPSTMKSSPPQASAPHLPSTEDLFLNVAFHPWMTLHKNILNFPVFSAG
jgi:hypothetical protein